MPASADAEAVVPNLTREVLRAIPNVALFVFDHDLRFLFCEGSSLRAQGFDPDEMEGRTLGEVLASDAEELEPMYRRALAGETVEFEAMAGDRKFAVTAAPMLDACGRIVGGSLLSVEMSDAHAADRVRRESLERLDRIAANVPGIVYQLRVDRNGVVSYPYISEGIRDTAGIEPDALRADPSLLLRMIHPDDLESFERSTIRMGSRRTRRRSGRGASCSGTARFAGCASPHVRSRRLTARPCATESRST